MSQLAIAAQQRRRRRGAFAGLALTQTSDMAQLTRWRSDCSRGSAMQQPQQRVVFAASMEAALRAFEPTTPEERVCFEALGLKLEALEPAYPLEAWHTLLDTSAASRFPRLPEFERYSQLGRLFMHGYARTSVGGALLSLLRVVGPERAVQRMTRNFRTANDFTDVEVLLLPPNGALLRFTHVERPGFVHGLLTAAMEAAEAPNLSVQFLSNEGAAATFEVRWSS